MTSTEILASTATRAQAQAAAAWRDIQTAKSSNFSAAEIRPLLANYAASRQIEIDAINAWQAGLGNA